VTPYLANLHATLAKGGRRARSVIHEDIEKEIVHAGRSETAKPLARAEVIATGKGLLGGVALVVGGALCLHRNGPSRSLLRGRGLMPADLDSLPHQDR
jgi:hypothetical protein